MPFFDDILDLVSRMGVPFNEADHNAALRTLDFTKDEASFQIQLVGRNCSLRCSRFIADHHEPRFEKPFLEPFLDYLEKETGIPYESTDDGEISVEVPLSLSSKTGLLRSDFSAQDIRKILDDQQTRTESSYSFRAEDGAEIQVDDGTIFCLQKEYASLDAPSIETERFKTAFSYLVDFLALATREAAVAAEAMLACRPTTNTKWVLENWRLHKQWRDAPDYHWQWRLRIIE